MEMKGPKRSAGMGLGPAVHPLLGSRFPTALESHLFAAQISTRSVKYLADHKVQGSVVVPGAAWVEVGLAAAAEVCGAASGFALANAGGRQANRVHSVQPGRRYIGTLLVEKVVCDGLRRRVLAAVPSVEGNPKGIVAAGFRPAAAGRPRLAGECSCWLPL
jgi:hypothetical protein